MTVILPRRPRMVAIFGYKGFDEVDGIEVAWNQVSLHQVFQTKEHFERRHSEVHLLKTLNHENIIKPHFSWVDDDKKTINLITEMFTLGSLRYRRKKKTVDKKDIRNLSRQILRGFKHLHSHSPPIIHSDLKYDNVFVNGSTGEVKIGDLGLAIMMDLSITTRIKFAWGSLLGASTIIGLICPRPRIAHAINGFDILEDDRHLGFSDVSGVDEDQRNLLAIIRKFMPPFLLFVTILMNLDHPAIFAIKLILILLGTKPSPLSIYISIEQLRRRYMREQPILFRFKVEVGRPLSCV